MWTIPDKGTAQSDFQSVLFSAYLDVLTAGMVGTDCVLSGCAVTAQGSPDMTCAVAKGAVLTNGILKPVTAGNVTITTADGSNPRIDLVVVNSSGTKAVRAGTPSATPAPPARTANDVVIAAVYVPASDTTISTDQIVDMRVIQASGPITIFKTVAAETTNTTSSAIEALNKAGSGVTIPSGLFLSGKTLRVRMGGNFLWNSGTPTVRIKIIYGGTTMFDVTSAASTADADRAAWFLTFDVCAQANADQALVGMLSISPIGARTTATTGIGPAFPTTAGTLPTGGPFSGAAAVDSNAGDRVLSVQFTMNVSNASDELVVETATVELV
jgi:hypothetical protein